MRFRRPERPMADAWGRKVVSVRHNYQEVEPHVPVMRKSLRLDSNAFAKKATATTVDLSGICSTVSTPSWFSTSPANTGLPAADLSILREAFAYDIRDFGGCVMDCFASPKHSLLIRRDAGEQCSGFGWHCCLFHMPGSAIAAWPVQLVGCASDVDDLYRVRFDSGAGLSAHLLL